MPPSATSANAVAIRPHDARRLRREARADLHRDPRRPPPAVRPASWRASPPARRDARASRRPDPHDRRAPRRSSSRSAAAPPLTPRPRRCPIGEPMHAVVPRQHRALLVDDHAGAQRQRATAARDERRVPRGAARSTPPGSPACAPPAGRAARRRRAPRPCVSSPTGKSVRAQHRRLDGEKEVRLVLVGVGRRASSSAPSATHRARARSGRWRSASRPARGPAPRRRRT